MFGLPRLISLVMAFVAVVAVVECLRAIAVLVRDEIRIHDLMTDSARAKISYFASIRGDDEMIGVDILED